MSNPHWMQPHESKLPVTRERREEVIDALCVHFATGRMRSGELERRLDAAYRARSGFELQALLADLGTLPLDKMDPGVIPPLAPPASVPPRGMMIAVMGGTERKGHWTVPRQMKVFFAAGGAELDLRHARFGPGVTEIDVSGIAGSCEILVPPGIRVETLGTAFMGAFEASAGDAGPPHEEQPVLRVSGFVMWGSVEVVLKGPSKRALKRFDTAWRAARRLQEQSAPDE